MGDSRTRRRLAIVAVLWAAAVAVSLLLSSTAAAHAAGDLLTTGPTPGPAVGPPERPSCTPLALPAGGWGGVTHDPGAGRTVPLPEVVYLADVPSYLWQHGCGPTSIGMIVGYWDGKDTAYQSLVAGSAATQTTAVDNAIASGDDGSAGTNVGDYCVPYDDSGSILADKSSTDPGGCHADACIADYMHTSRSADGLRHGWSWTYRTSYGFEGYVESIYSGYEPGCQQYTISDDSDAADMFGLLRDEILAGHPMGMVVDTNGDGSTDHFVAAIGYDTINGTYACWDTWSHSVRWQILRPMSTSYTWGVKYLYSMHPDDGVAPTVTASGYAGWHNDFVQVTFNGSDEAGGSGYCTTSYYIDAPGVVYEGTNAVVFAFADHSADGDHVITYWGSDRVGNYTDNATVTVHIDTRKPATKAPRSASVRRGRVVTLRYRVNDAAPNGGTATVTIKVKTKSGKTVKTLKLGERAVNTTLSAKFRCRLAKRTYRFVVYAKDAALNAQASPAGSNRLTVR